MRTGCECQHADHETPCGVRLEKNRRRCSRCRWRHPLGIRPGPLCADCGGPVNDYSARRCLECYRLRPTGRTFAERFWDKVSPAQTVRAELGPCWEWLGNRSPFGYGRASRGRRGAPAHRVSWELVVGPIPDGLIVLHRCDNRACVRPSHLSTGTGDENMADMVAKGRSVRGERAHTSKLTESQVRTIRQRAEQGETRRVLSAEFGVSPTTISHLRHGKSWRHVA